MNPLCIGLPLALVPILGAALGETDVSGGVAPRISWGDFDSDGRPDVFAVTAGAAGRLLHNSADGTFVDVTARAGLEQLPAAQLGVWRDVDGDGDQDLLVAGHGFARLMLGNARGSFVDASGVEGLPHPGGTTLSLAWLDFDGDGRDDLHLSARRGDVILRNAGRGLFEPVDLGLPLEQPLPRGAGRVGESRAATAGVSATSVKPTGQRAAAAASGICAASLMDSLLGGCMTASAVPALGSLMPLSIDFNVDSAGNVGVGTITPGVKLDVEGDVRSSGQLVSTAPSGAPLSVASSDLVPDLNADLLDGLEASAFSQLGATIESAEITDGTITSSDLGPGAVGRGSISAGSVGASELATGAVTNAKIASSAVDTTQVVNGTLLNADLSASAAIAGSKVVPSFGAQVVTTTGSIGAGTSTPEVRLHAGTGTDASLAGGGYLQLGNQSSANLALDSNELMARSGGSASDLFVNNDGGDVLFSANGNGKVGVGTSSPEGPLHVLEGSAGSVTANSNSIAVFERSTGGFLSILGPDGFSKGLLFGNPTSNASGGLVYDQASVGEQSMQFRTGGNATRMTITKSGLVGVGTSFPSAKLHVVDSTGGDGSVKLPSSSISSGEMLNEMGIASRHAYNRGFITAIGDDPVETTLAVRVITAPSAGYILALAHCTAQSLGVSKNHRFSVSKLSASHEPDNVIEQDLTDEERTVSMQAVFAIGAGQSQNFYFLASSPTSSATAFAGDVRLTLLFVPTAYGAVDVD